MDAHLPVDAVILGAAALLALGLVGTGIAARTPVPSLLISLGLGMAIGSDGLGLVQVGLTDLHWVEGASIAALALILFAGGLGTSAAAVRAQGVPAALLATVGVAMTMAIVAFAARPLLDLGWGTSLLLGAVVASTDAAAIFAALRGIGVPSRVRSLLEVESGLNDPMAVLLTVGVLAAVTGSVGATDWLTFGARQVLGGLVAAAVVGGVGSTMLQRIRFHSAAAAAVTALSLAGLAYGLATTAGGSGLLAAYLTGVIVGHRVTRHKRLIVGLHDALGEVAEIGLFLLLGLLVEPSQLPAQAGRAVIVAAVLVFVARPVAVGVLLPWFRFRPRELAVVAWGGLRGAVPIVLATLPLIAGEPAGLAIFNVVFFVVILSTALQGMTLGPLVRRLGLGADPGPWDPIVESLPIERLGGELVELELGPDAPVADQALRQVPLPAHCRITAIIRGDEVVVPDGDTVLAAGDLLLVFAPDAEATTAALRAWASVSGPRADRSG